MFLSEQILRVKNGGTNIPAILVGNKIDLAEKRKVTPDEAEQKARSWSIRYIETSAKTKHNVDKVNEDLKFKEKKCKARENYKSWKVFEITTCHYFVE